MITFVPNDPLAGAPPTRKVDARPDRKDDQAGFAVAGNEPEKIYAIGTAGFLRWQARQAAILAVEAWEEVLGRPLLSWAQALDDPMTLPVLPDAGDDLNAGYTRADIEFYHHTTGGKTTFAAASTDVVAHETGHAILDALRPDLWGTNLLEVGGFHEAFGDITAIITALADRDTRSALLAVAPDLDTANFVEGTAEDLSDAVRRALGPNHPASKPRRALNTFRWQLPATMPASGGPDVMIAEVHSIARIFSGCFYDLVRALFTQAASPTEAALWEATRQAAALVWNGAANAPEVPRFFRAVGRQMVLADARLNGGANRALIGKAFLRHAIALGSSSLLSPESLLPGFAPRVERATAATEAKVRVDDATIANLRRRVGAEAGAAAAITAVELDDTVAAKVSFQDAVSLDDVDERLQGVVARVSIPVLVGESGRAAALLDTPAPGVTDEETREFVRALIDQDQLAFEPTGSPPSRYTHTVEERDGRRELVRMRFSC